MYLTSLAVRNAFISALVNGYPMSDTIDSRMPWVTNKVLGFLLMTGPDCLEMTRDVKVPLEVDSLRFDK